MGLYANGLRVLRDISPDLLAAVRAAGYDYIYRRWQRHDGTEVACASEAELTDDPELQSIGIRRWKFQKALCDAAAAAGIQITFAKRTESVEPRDDGCVNVKFADGSQRTARFVIGADGVKSKVREAVVGKMAAEFTGVTCLMGAAKVARPVRGICFPSSRTTKCHGCFYPTSDGEQIFQLYFPAKTVEEAWGTLSSEDGTRECADLAAKLASDGWDEAFLAPLRNAESVIRTAICSRPPLHKWAAASGRIALLGDAAHPPVPYIGQGAQMAMEDCGVFAHLLKHHCCAAGTAPFDPSDANLAAATSAYEALRIPRTHKILGSSHTLGKTQQRRAESWWYNFCRELEIKVAVARHGTLPIMKPGAAYNFADDVARFVAAPGTAPPAPAVDESSASPESSSRSSAVLVGVAAVAATAALVALSRRK